MRQGVDLNLQLKTDRLLAWFAYFYIDSQTGFTASSTNNPEADADRNIQVRPGNCIPDIPSNLWKMGSTTRSPTPGPSAEQGPPRAVNPCSGTKQT